MDNHIRFQTCQTGPFPLQIVQSFVWICFPETMLPTNIEVNDSILPLNRNCTFLGIGTSPSHSWLLDYYCLSKINTTDEPTNPIRSSIEENVFGYQGKISGLSSKQLF